MFQGGVNSVSCTNILISAVNDRPDLQLVAYFNKVDILDKPVAMILPFPNFTEKNLVEVVPTTEKDISIFKYLEYAFNHFRGFGSSSSREALAVHRAGSYRYSIVNNIEDFKYINKDVFQLYDKNIEAIFRKHYDGFGFIVCIIDKSAEYSPFIYITEKLPNNLYFIPTRHYHGHISETDHWDHRIYILGTTEDEFIFEETPGVFEKTTGKFIPDRYRVNSVNAYEDIDLKKLTCGKFIPAFQKESCKLITLFGNLKNCDISIKAI
jgi:hypothetical protein